MTNEELWTVGRQVRRLLDQQDDLNLSQLIAVPFGNDMLGGIPLSAVGGEGYADGGTAADSY